MINYFVWVKVALQAIVIGLIFAGGYGLGVSKGEIKIVTLEKKHAFEQVRAASEAAAAQRSEQVRQNNHVAALEKVAATERKRAEGLAVRVSRLERSAVLVRDQFTRIATQAGTSGEGAESASGSEASATALVVLADVYRSTDAEAVELGQALDRAYARGRTCEAAYAAVTADDPPED